jgi:hypothetical protein
MHAYTTTWSEEANGRPACRKEQATYRRNASPASVVYITGPRKRPNPGSSLRGRPISDLIKSDATENPQPQLDPSQSRHSMRPPLRTADGRAERRTSSLTNGCCATLSETRNQEGESYGDRTRTNESEKRYA